MELPAENHGVDNIAALPRPRWLYCGHAHPAPCMHCACMHTCICMVLGARRGAGWLRGPAPGSDDSIRCVSPAGRRGFPGYPAAERNNLRHIHSVRPPSVHAPHALCLHAAHVLLGTCCARCDIHVLQASIPCAFIVFTPLPRQSSVALGRPKTGAHAPSR